MGKVFDRQQLYELVWSKPMRVFAAEFGISDVAVAKACRSALIPVPPRGYWASKPDAQRTLKRSLPPRFPGSSDRIPIGFGRALYRHELLTSPTEDSMPPPEPVFEEPIDAVRARVKKMLGQVSFQNDFNTAIPPVRILLEHDKERRQAKWSYDRPRYDDGIERRRLLLLNSLGLGLARIGCAMLMSTSRYQYGSEPRTVSVRVGGMYVSICLETPKAGSRSTQSKPNLRLTIDEHVASEDKELFWDDNRGKLERQLSEIASNIVLQAEVRHRRAKVHHREWFIERIEQLKIEAQERRAEEERQRIERQRAEERRRVDELLAQASLLHQADVIRKYVASVRERTTGTSSVEEIESWSSWALAQADRIDPVKARSFLGVE